MCAEMDKRFSGSYFSANTIAVMVAFTFTVFETHYAQLERLNSRLYSINNTKKRTQAFTCFPNNPISQLLQPGTISAL